jgi:hypothetical protein
MGWYAGRVCGLVSGGLVLFALLYEITLLYGQLLRAVLAQRREREARLMTGDAVADTIAHEIKQPLSAMITSAGAGLRWIDRPMPDLDEARAAFKEIAADGRRAGAVSEASTRCSRQNRTAWGWASRSAVRSSRGHDGQLWVSANTPNSSCAPIRRPSRLHQPLTRRVPLRRSETCPSTHRQPAIN